MNHEWKKIKLFFIEDKENQGSSSKTILQLFQLFNPILLSLDLKKLSQSYCNLKKIYLNHEWQQKKKEERLNVKNNKNKHEN